MSHPRGARPRLFVSLFGLFILALIVFPQTAKKPQRIVNTDPQQRLAWFDEFAKMKTASKFKDLKWQFLGPNNVSGRVTDVAVVAPKGRNYTIYAATASGGVWKTDNEGITWAPVFENAVSTAIGDIALDPSDPQTVWIGTGECNIFRSSQAGAGVYKSTDGGKTWTHKGLAATQTIARIIVHPKNPDVVYVAASGHEWTLNPERGVYKTVDGGRNWEKVLSVDDETGAIDLVMDPKDNDTVYAAMWQRTRPKWNDPRNNTRSAGSGIWKTTDAGKSWTPINNGLPEAKFRGRIGIDLCLSKPNVLYAYVDNYEKAREATAAELADSYGLPSAGIIKGATVYRSDDKGGSWKQVTGLTPEQKAFMERHSNTYGWVFGQIRVDPNDENTFYTMGLSLNTSTNGGKTVTRVNGLQLPDQGIRPGHRRLVRQGEELAVFPKGDPGLPVLQRQLRHGHAVQGLWLHAGPRQLPRRRRPEPRPRPHPDRDLRLRAGRRRLQPRHRSQRSRHRLFGRLLRHPVTDGIQGRRQPSQL